MDYTRNKSWWISIVKPLCIDICNSFQLSWVSLLFCPFSPRFGDIFRSHPYAFSVDGSCQCLILSGNSETESQLWMRQIRDLLWPRAPSIWLRTGNWILSLRFFTFFSVHKWENKVTPSGGSNNNFVKRNIHFAGYYGIEGLLWSTVVCEVMKLNWLDTFTSKLRW